MNNKLTPLLQFVALSLVAIVIGTVYLNDGIVKNTNATLTSVATSVPQSIDSGSWAAVLGSDPSSTATGPYSAVQQTPYEDITTTSPANPVFTVISKCSTNTGNKKIYLSSNNTSLQVGMQVTSTQGANPYIYYGVIASISTSSSNLSNCTGSQMMVSLQNNTTVQIFQGVNLDFRASTPVYTGKTCVSTSSGATHIYLGSFKTEISPGMTVWKNNTNGPTTYGVVQSVELGEFSNCSNNNDMHITLVSGSSASISNSQDLLFQLPDVPVVTVTGHSYSAIVSLNNTGTRSIGAVTISHTNPATTLESCTSTYVNNVCQGIASAITPDSSHPISLAVGGSVSIKVTLTVNDLVTTLADTLSVAVSNSQLEGPRDTHS